MNFFVFFWIFLKSFEFFEFFFNFFLKVLTFWFFFNFFETFFEFFWIFLNFFEFFWIVLNFFEFFWIFLIFMNFSEFFVFFWVFLKSFEFFWIFFNCGWKVLICWFVSGFLYLTLLLQLCGMAYSPPKPKHCFAVRLLVILLQETVESLRLMRTSFPFYTTSHMHCHWQPNCWP